MKSVEKRIQTQVTPTPAGLNYYGSTPSGFMFCDFFVLSMFHPKLFTLNPFGIFQKHSHPVFILNISEGDKHE